MNTNVLFIEKVSLKGNPTILTPCRWSGKRRKMNKESLSSRGKNFKRPGIQQQ